MKNSPANQLKFQIFLFTFIRTVINSGLRMIYPLLPLFAAGMGVELSDISAAISIRSILGVLSPFVATLGDVRGRKQSMLLGVSLFVLGTGVTALMQNFLGFVIGASLLLIGNGVFIPSVQSFLSDRVSFERRGRIMSITELSWSLSFIIGIPALGYLLEKFSWVAPFIALTVLGALLLLILWRMIPRDIPEKKDGQHIFLNLKKTMRHLPVLAGLGVGLMAASSNEVVNLVFGVWIEDSFGLALTAMVAASVVIGGSELLSEFGSVMLLDKIGKRRAILFSLILNSLSAILLPLGASSLPVALIGLAFFYITFEVFLISLLTLMSEVFPQARATVMAVTIAIISAGRMIGSLLGSPLYQLSFWAVCIAAVLLNTLAVASLYFVKLPDRANV